MVNHTVQTTLSVQEAVDKLQSRLKENSFGVLHIYNLREIFKSKGIEFGEYQILSVCNPKFAKEALDIDLEIGAFLPCKISVYHDHGITKIVLLQPSEVMGLLNNKKLNVLGEAVEDILIKVVNSVR